MYLQVTTDKIELCQQARADLEKACEPLKNKKAKTTKTKA